MDETVPFSFEFKCVIINYRINILPYIYSESPLFHSISTLEQFHSEFVALAGLKWFRFDNWKLNPKNKHDSYNLWNCTKSILQKYWLQIVPHTLKGVSKGFEFHVQASLTDGVWFLNNDIWIRFCIHGPIFILDADCIWKWIGSKVLKSFERYRHSDTKIVTVI